MAETQPLPNVRLTRFHDKETGLRLGYRHDAPAEWRIYESRDGERWNPVGIAYRTEKELVTELPRYAREYEVFWGV